MRAADQVFVGIWISDVLADKIEQARGSTPRSQFFRDAVAELLASKGFPVGDEKNAPDRVKSKYPAHRSQSVVMNEKPSSKPAAGHKRLLKKVGESVTGSAK